ncbi:MAG TPA: metallophosphoesterase, partial [Longimicrobiales bacterium]|nr:metallophosphoesterase [Longimicrobiales bacterium]
MNRTIRDIGIAAAGAAAAAAVYALYIEPRWLQCTRTRMSFAALPPELEGLRIALLTDLHTGTASPDGLARRVAEMTMREHPDLIAISGDIAESEPMLEQTLDDLAKLSAPLGVYIVPGNHDYRDVGIERWHDAVARRPNLVDLTNSARLLEVPSGRTAPGSPVPQSPSELTASEAASGAD